MYWQHYSDWDESDATHSEEPNLSSHVLIECRNVYKSFGRKEVLKGANFKVKILINDDFDISGYI